jgi:hypothetical protein
MRSHRHPRPGRSLSRRQRRPCRQGTNGRKLGDWNRRERLEGDTVMARVWFGLVGWEGQLDRVGVCGGIEEWGLREKRPVGGGRVKRKDASGSAKVVRRGVSDGPLWRAKLYWAGPLTLSIFWCGEEKTKRFLACLDPTEERRCLVAKGGHDEAELRHGHHDNYREEGEMKEEDLLYTGAGDAWKAITAMLVSNLFRDHYCHLDFLCCY